MAMFEVDLLVKSISLQSGEKYKHFLFYCHHYMLK